MSDLLNKQNSGNRAIIAEIEAIAAVAQFVPALFRLVSESDHEVAKRVRDVLPAKLATEEAADEIRAAMSAAGKAGK
jgi:galactose-1-phosphate uridylyltransferase